MSKKAMIITIISVFVIFVFFLFWDSFRAEQRNAKRIEEEKANQWYDMNMADREDVGGRDADYEPMKKYISIPNVNEVYDYLTLKAISELSNVCETFLFNNGYTDARTLYVDTESFQGDRSLFTFHCKIAEYPNTTLSVTYILNDEEYQLKIE